MQQKSAPQSKPAQSPPPPMYQQQQIPMQMQMQMPTQIPMQMQMPAQMPMQMNVQIPMQQMPMQQMVMPNYYQQPAVYGGYGDQGDMGSTIALIGQNDKEFMNKKTAAIIISIHSGQTYDGLFTTVQQKSQEGTKTLVYSAGANSVGKLIEGFEGKSKDEIVVEMFK